MPFKSVRDLPEAVRDHLPPHAEEIFLAAFNSAWEEYKNPQKRTQGGTREEVAFQVAWAAVKNSYYKDEKTGRWLKLKKK